MFYIKLREVLKEKNMTQKELAEKTGMTEATISRYVSNGRQPTTDKLIKICNVLDVSADRLLGIKRKWHKGKPKEEGYYYVTLIYDKILEDCKTQKVGGVYERYLSDLDKHPEEKGWKMAGEPDEGLAWTEESGSHSGEQVIAWMEMEGYPDIADLPRGVVEEGD